MATPFERIQLFNTVKNLHDAGKVKLTSRERRQIEAETADLIHRSVRNKTAMKTPEGFEEVLEKLKSAESADEAFQFVADFLKERGIIEGEEHEEKEEKLIGDIGKKTEEFEEMEKGEEGEEGEERFEEFEEGGEMKELSPPPGFPPKKKEGPEKEGPEKEGPEKEGPGKKGPEKSDGPKKEDDAKDSKEGPKDKSEEKKSEDMKEARRALIRRAMEPEHGSGKRQIQDLQNKKKEMSESEISAAEMGVEEAEVTTGDLMATTRARKIKIAITPERNLVAQHEDYGPVFHAVPNASIKKDLEALRRLANKVYGVAVYRGFKVAAKLCNAKLIRTAGVDDGIELDSDKKVAPKQQGILGDAETNSRERPEGDSGSSISGVEVDTREKPGVTTDIKTEMIKDAKRREMAKSRAKFLARKLRSRDILDMAENVTQNAQPSKPSGNTGDGAVNDERDGEPKPADSVLVDSDDDIRHSTARNLKDLYKKRAEKRIEGEKEAFVRKFTRAIRIASARMSLNHDEHPMKVAAVDVLTANDVSFSNGERYAGMDLGTAVELTELIASEGHDQFVGRLLAKAADLLEKSDEYLADVEADLRDLSPVPVGSEISHMGSSNSRNRRSSRVRRDAAEGNFTRSKNGTPPPSSPERKTSNNLVRNAISGGTALGRRLGRARD